MKILAACAATLFAVSQLSAQAQPYGKPAESKPASPAVAPATGAASKKDGEKAEPELTIPGQTIARADGTFLGLQAVGGQFTLSFYDKKKKPMAIDVTRATARWPNSRGRGENRTVLNPSGTALIGAQHVDPPFTFKVYLTLLRGEGDESKAVENYVVDFRG